MNKEIQIVSINLKLKTMTVRVPLDPDDLEDYGFGSFLPNYSYAKIASQIRNYFFAPKMIKGFPEGFLVDYRLWTRQFIFNFKRVIFYDSSPDIFVEIFLSGYSKTNFILGLKFFSQERVLFCRAIHKIAIQEFCEGEFLIVNNLDNISSRELKEFLSVK